MASPGWGSKMGAPGRASPNLCPRVVRDGGDSSLYVSTWAQPRCPDLWSNLILGVSVRVFLCETNTEVRRLGGQPISLPTVGGPRPIRGRLEQNKRPLSPEQMKRLQT